jgi:site-specific DNA recombinase
MAHILDAAVWARVEEVLLDPRLIAIEADKYLSAEVSVFDLEGLDRRLRDISRRQARLAQAIAALDDDDASTPLLVELKQLSGDSQKLKAERARIEIEAEQISQKQRALADLDGWCARVAQNLHSLTYEEKRMVLETLGVSVKVFSTTHDPRWTIDLHPV